MADASENQTLFDPLRETAPSWIKIFDRADGGKEFILPALRNFRAKLAFSFFWLVMTVCFAVIAFAFVSASFISELPALIRFFLANHIYFALGIVALIDLLLTIVCLDQWLRSSRIIATTGELQVVTHWLFFKRATTIPASKIIEMKADNTTTVDETRYYDLVVLTVGDKKSWLARNFAAKRKAGSSFTENDLKVFNTGGKRITAATGIKDQREAEWLLAQLRAALGVSV